MDVKIKKLFFILFFIFLFSTSLQASEIKGYVRSVNYEGHSFSLDVPPLQRVWVSPATRFDSGAGYGAFRSLKEGDYASIEGALQSNQIFNAQTVKLLKNGENKGSEISVDLNQTFLLEVNQKANVKGENLSLLGVEVFDDLCKDGMNCDEGSMSFRMVMVRGKEKKDILLKTREGRKPIKPIVSEALGYKIELIEIGESAALLVVRK